MEELTHVDLKVLFSSKVLFGTMANTEKKIASKSVTANRSIQRFCQKPCRYKSIFNFLKTTKRCHTFHS